MHDDLAPVFFEAQYDYRRWSTYLTIFGYLTATASLIGLYVDRWAVVPKIGAFGLMGVFSVIWILAAMAGVGRLIWRIVFRPIVEVRIDHQGIHNEGRLVPWHEVNEVVGKFENPVLMRFIDARQWRIGFRRRSAWWPAPVRLLRMDKITAEAYEQFLLRLEPFLQVHFPEVKAVRLL